MYCVTLCTNISCVHSDVSQNGVTMIASGVFDPLPELQELLDYCIAFAYDTTV